MPNLDPQYRYRTELANLVHTEAEARAAREKHAALAALIAEARARLEEAYFDPDAALRVDADLRTQLAALVSCILDLHGRASDRAEAHRRRHDSAKAALDAVLADGPGPNARAPRGVSAESELDDERPTTVDAAGGARANAELLRSVFAQHRANGRFRT
jgi:hypothetical protein